MIPTRPQHVAEDATVIYPGQTFGPGFGVQQATLAAIYAQIGRLNANSQLHYANALRDWHTNVEIDQAYGLPIPPTPAKAQVIVLKVTYADVSGNVLTSSDAGDGSHYAWIEETTA